MTAGPTPPGSGAPPPGDPEERARQLVGAVAERTDRLVAAASALSPADLVGPSALPGWSRLTVLCHLRFGAETLTRMTADALAGRPTAYYPGGRAIQRPGTLVPRPGEDPAAVVRSVAATAERLDQAWRRVPGPAWARTVHEPAGHVDLGPLPLAHLVLSRLTEVEVHGTDLEVGLAGWSEVFVHTALGVRLGRLARRRPEAEPLDPGLRGSWLLVATGGPAQLVSVAAGAVRSEPAPPGTPATARLEADPADLLALLLGRPVSRPLRWTGDPAFAAAFARAFPGP